MSFRLLIEQMTVQEKIEAMELLWASLSRSGNIPTPEWHAEVLAEREEAARDPNNFEDLEEVKLKLRERRQ